MPYLFLLVSLLMAWFTYNAYRPSFAPARRSGASWIAGWITTELPLHHIAWQAVLVGLFAALGGLHGVAGKLGLLVTAISWVALGTCFGQALRARGAVGEALRESLGRDIAPLPAAPSATQWAQIALPLPVRDREVERIVDIPFRRVAGVTLKLDIYRHRERPTGCPVLLHMHGGGWVIGTKRTQGLPLVYHMARNGWLCVNANYRLSPHATFPDHLIDLKHALCWVRTRAHEYGADPSLVVVSGESAGAHLASLMALTANDPRYQSELGDADTTVQGCVGFYGVYDFTDRNGIWRHEGLRRLLEVQVMKASLEEAPDRWEEASPISRIQPDAPPFMVIHGSHDSLVPVEEARHFCEIFRERAKAPIVYAEIPGAQHAFELFPSVRTVHVLNGVERFLAWLRERHARASSKNAKTPGNG